MEQATDTDRLLAIARRALTALATLSFVSIGFAGAVGWSDGFIAWAAILTMVASVGLLAVTEEQSIRNFNRRQDP